MKVINATSLGLALLAFGAAAQPAWAQVAWPTGEIRMFVAAAAGGSTDLVARTLETHLEKQLDTNILVVNQTAGGGAVATSSVATAEPDGGTILLHHALLHTTYLFGRSDINYESYDTLGTVSQVNNLLVASADAPYKTLAELKDYAAANSGTLRLASQLGGTTQVLGDAVASWGEGHIRVVDAGTEADRVVAILGDQVDLALLTVSTAAQYVEAGEVVPLAVFNKGAGRSGAGLAAGQFGRARCQLPAGLYPACHQGLAGRTARYVR
ncbi:tripartite tricarboxylate transporter substrate-binding protein [Devosia ginsengisoli]|uniref:Tripartite tricarboxylate transporter substrate binding protein n=1 Tax=Devosia ginsengisoli TaxID=400770 RepID=A0A5B8LZL5_9HYPH|nr:tripartite tricarboxylate transporter substrate-binding protein [Devosia ginsengisoli]QDZ12820.1 hypothetical protein FPZ08_19970 [Devosia ginsengisoli]